MTALSGWKLAAVLAGLRLVQQRINSGRSDGFHSVDDVLTDGGRHPLPTVEAIDGLCEALNLKRVRL